MIHDFDFYHNVMYDWVMSNKRTLKECLYIPIVKCEVSSNGYRPLLWVFHQMIVIKKLITTCKIYPECGCSRKNIISTHWQYSLKWESTTMTDNCNIKIHKSKIVPNLLKMKIYHKRGWHLSNKSFSLHIY